MQKTGGASRPSPLRIKTEKIKNLEKYRESTREINEDEAPGLGWHGLGYPKVIVFTKAMILY